MIARIALALVLWAIIDVLFFGYVAAAIGMVFDYRMITVQWLLGLVAEAVVAWFLSGPILAKDVPTKSPLVSVTLAAVAVYLVVRLAPLVGLSPGFTGFGTVLRGAALVAFAGAVFAAVKLWRPRWMLFAAVTGIALQFKVGAAFGLLLLWLPSGTADVITLAAALLIAALLSFREDSPADRVREPHYLWFFGAAGLLAIVYGFEPELVPRFLGGGLFTSRYTLILGSLVFLWTLLAFASRVDPVDEHGAHGQRAGGLALLGVLVALMVLVGVTFGFNEFALSVFPDFAPGPLVGCLLLSAGVMFFMRLLGRIPAGAPGLGMIAAGAVALILAVLGGWRMGSEFSSAGGSGAWLGLVFLVILVAPLAVLAQLLTGIGLLRVLFSLQPPLGVRAHAASVAPAQSDPGATVPTPPAPGTPRERTPPPAPAPMPTSPQEIGAQLAADVRGNRMLRVTETVERGLAADAKFFVGHPDDTLALAKRLVAVERADLALRILQPYLVSHRSHRQHLTNALLVASLLARDPSRLADAARFLKQVKALYPREPMVDQLIKSTDKAIAAAPAK